MSKVLIPLNLTQLKAIQNIHKGRDVREPIPSDEADEFDALRSNYNVMYEYFINKDVYPVGTKVIFEKKNARGVPTGEILATIDKVTTNYLGAKAKKPDLKVETVTETGAVVNNPLVGAGAPVTTTSETIPLINITSETGSVSDSLSTVSTPSFGSMANSVTSDTPIRKKVIKIATDTDYPSTADTIWERLRYVYFTRYLLESYQHTLGRINHSLGFDTRGYMPEEVRTLIVLSKLGEILKTADKELKKKTQPLITQLESLETLEEKKAFKAKHQPELYAFVERLWKFINQRFEVVPVPRKK